MASSSATRYARQSMRSFTSDHSDSRRSGLCCCKLGKQSLTRQLCRSPIGLEPTKTIRWMAISPTQPRRLKTRAFPQMRLQRARRRGIVRAVWYASERRENEVDDRSTSCWLSPVSKGVPVIYQNASPKPRLAESVQVLAVPHLDQKILLLTSFE